MHILRFITAGSVDDGKSTLIGRLLYDSKSILADQLEQLEKQSKNKNEQGIDLALLTDGLRAEREQGITIDVAYRYFATARRKFIIADAPGHVQYTRNMITGASNAELIVILIDARQGVVEQTRRHSIIASLLKIPHVVVAINKMDLVDYSEDVFNNIVIDYSAVANQLGLHQVSYFPISALQGDNIVDASTQMPWYEGGSLLQFLETVALEEDVNYEIPRFQVQYVIRPQTPELHDYRGYAGRISTGIYRRGDAVTVLPSGLNSRISSIEIGGVPVEEAFAPQSVVIQLEDDLDISRGDAIVPGTQLPELRSESDVLLCWMDDKPLLPGNKYLLQHQGRQVRTMIRELQARVDVNTLQEEVPDGPVVLNEIVKAKIKTAQPLAVDAFSSLPQNGAAILIDETSNHTVAAVLFT